MDEMQRCTDAGTGDEVRIKESRSVGCDEGTTPISTSRAAQSINIT